MAVRFLSQEWAQAVTEALNSSSEFSDAAARHPAKLQQVVTDTPAGETKYYFAIDEGAAQMGIGEIEGAEATITQSYDTAVAISKREIHPQQAFMQGKLRVTGNIMKLLQMQSVLSALSHAVASLEVEYDAE
ncbi:MAG: SCP2 sterol-binding domain-containing protein [Actinomycetota bacterium]